MLKSKHRVDWLVDSDSCINVNTCFVAFWQEASLSVLSEGYMEVNPLPLHFTEKNV